MKQFQIDTFSLLHDYVKTQKDTSASTTNLNKDLPQSQPKEESTEDKMKRKEREMKKKTKEMQKREYELVKELEKLRRKNEIERKKRRELERMEEYKYYKDILENDEKLYKKMLVRVPIASNNPNSSISKSQNLGSIENLESKNSFFFFFYIYIYIYIYIYMCVWILKIFLYNIFIIYYIHMLVK